MPAIGFTINLRPQAASDNLLVAFKDFAVANISDAMSRTTGSALLEIAEGTVDRSWVDLALKNKGVLST